MRTARLATSAMVVVCLGLVSQDLRADERLTVDHILDWERVADPQVAPDGSQLVYTRSMVNRMKDRWESELWILDIDGSRHRFLVKGSNARWSPDGSRIAYVADGEPDGQQIFVRWMDAEGAASQISRLTEKPGGLAWAPDGTSIAFTMIVPARETWDIDVPPPPQGATWTDAPRVVRRTHYRQDRQGFMQDGYRHVFMLPSDGGAPRALTEGTWHVGARGSGLDGGARLSWTPDGRTIVFDGLRDDDADRKYRESHVYGLDVASGEIRQITARRGPWSRPTVSPDGQSIAFTGYDWTSQTYRADELYVIGIDGTGMRSLTSTLDRDPRNPMWARDGSGIYFHTDDHGSRNVHLATLDGRVRAVTDGVQMLSLSSIAHNGTAVGVATSFQAPPDVVRFDVAEGAETLRLTHVNDDVLTDVSLADVEEIWYESSDGTRVQGWVVKPPDFDPERRYPLILQIHGGPHGMYNVGFNNSFQHFAANDFVVLYTNPRGSTGYGTEFGNAIDNGYPSVDHEDLMAGVDSILDRGYVDANQLYVTGCSGGGVLSSWAIGQTDRFAAAAVRCPVVNWISFAGNTDITVWGYYRFDGYPWDNPAKWLEHSPLMHVGKVKTPTLLMTGELDLRTPMAQTEEYYQALRALGVETVMLRFKKEYHGTGSMPSNFMRTQLYIMDWFRTHVKATDTTM